MDSKTQKNVEKDFLENYLIEAQDPLKEVPSESDQGKVGEYKRVD